MCADVSTARGRMGRSHYFLSKNNYQGQKSCKNASSLSKNVRYTTSAHKQEDISSKTSEI